MAKDKDLSTVTSSIHAGFSPEYSENSVNPAVFQSTTFIFPSAQDGKTAFSDALSGVTPKYLIYGRHNHPGAEILEERLAKIDCCNFQGYSSVFCSGMAGINTIISVCRKKGMKYIYHTAPVYGGTYELFYHVLQGDMIPCAFNKASDLKKLYKQNGELGVIYIESPANPTMSIFNIKKIAKEAKRIDPSCVVILDNTFLGIFQKPFLMSEGVDVVLYSATKFIGGHSDVLAGAVTVKDAELNILIKGLRMVYGNILSPDSCERLIRSLPTYELRMIKQQGNAKKVVKFLKSCDQVEKILYPGKGSLVSFTLKNADEEKTFKFLDIISAGHIISQAVSLGGVESLVTHPKTTTRSEMDEITLSQLGITDNFIRLSIGLEDPCEIIELLASAFKKIL